MRSKSIDLSTHVSDNSRLHNHSISPSLPSNAVLLRTLAAPVNPADVNQIQGVYPSKPPLTSLLGTSQPSAVGGNEGCFEVVSVGSNVKSVQKSDWVIMSHTNFGTWRTHAQAEEKDIIKIDDKTGLNPVQVGTVSVNPCTAYRMLKDFTEVKEGEWFIQNGANSGVGRAAIQLGKLWGMKSINIIRERSSPEETQAMKDELVSLGATQVVTESELLDRKTFKDQIAEWTNGGRESIKLGLNCVGGKPTAALIKQLSQGGHLVTYGGMAKQPLDLPTGLLIFKDLNFSGFWVSRWSDNNPQGKKKMVEEILQLTRDGSFKDVPVQKLEWNWGTQSDELVKAIQGTLEGFRAGKTVFMFGDT